MGSKGTFLDRQEKGTDRSHGDQGPEDHDSAHCAPAPFFTLRVGVHHFNSDLSL